MGQNFVNMRFIFTKISGPRHEIMLREVLPELSTICTAFTVYRLSQRDVTVNLTSVLLIWQSDSGGGTCLRACVQAKGRHFEHKLSH